MIYRELEVYAASVTNSYNEFTGGTLFEAVARAMWDYHANDVAWKVRSVREVTNGGVYVDVEFHWTWDDADNTWETSVYCTKRTMYVPCA